jgi:LysM repeat protein
MPYRSPARFLAPVALVAAVLAVYLVVHAGSSTSPGPSITTVTTAAQRGPRASRHTPRTYVVRTGDTLSAIAVRTGVPLARLEQLNPSVDANTLHAGQKLKLRAAS